MTGTPVVQANGAAIPAVGLGTWALKGDAGATAVAQALGLGYRHIDTAAMYGNEAAVGEGLRASGVPRDAVFITSKVWTDALTDGALQRSADASVRRLSVDRLDLLLVHWPNPAVPLAETMGALCDVKRRGLTAHIGVSNFSVALLEDAVRLATEPLVTNQCKYDPLVDQHDLLAACRRLGLAFTSYSPLGRGDIVRQPDIRRIAAEHGRSPAQIVLRWHVQQPGVVTIPKASSTGHLAENLAIFDFTLSEADMAAISALARR